MFNLTFIMLAMSYFMYTFFISFSYNTYYLYLVLHFYFYLFIMLLISSLPYTYLLGGSLFLLMIAFISWGGSYMQSLLFLTPSVNSSTFMVIVLFIFNNFLYLLRPFTLTLRVFINISVGHFMLSMLSSNSLFSVLLMFIFELFVFFIQSFVFMVLSFSYY